ncbi:MAG: glycosyltransferase [Candidatus Cohnella colombiensis]|uniref:Glycosyltransferase n=1 Tax=Candidatus Cohnella colombiensis TaxID=3121368 RepID=A0AA95F248_9BACL|nr:MAG: glycosyltransferase [Cohnella sp.]
MVVMRRKYRKGSRVRRLGRIGDLTQQRQEGYTLGWEHGHWLGRCEAVMQQAIPQSIVRPLHVLYVTSGKGYPYSPIDLAICESLKLVVAKVSVAQPNQDIVRIAAQEQPDLLLVLEGMNTPVEKVYAVKELGIRTAIWFTDDPYYTDITSELARAYDCIFTLERNCVQFYGELGCSRVHYLPLGVYPVAYRPRNPSVETRGDICFIGSAYWNRVSLFQQIIPRIAHRKMLISGLWWDRLPNYRRYRSRIQVGAWMDPISTCEKYNAHKIVINAHRAHDDDTYNRNRFRIAAVSPNPRTFEISASATLQLTDRREDIEQFYVPDKEIVIFENAQDLANKMEYYLAHEEERREIALRGLYRTMKNHTYVSRLNQLIDLALVP